MTDAQLSVDVAAAIDAGDRITRRYLTAGTRAVVTATEELYREVQRATEAATPRSRLFRAWERETFPSRGPARNPAGIVYVSGNERIRKAMIALTRPGTIRGRDGGFLAIPLPAAGSLGRGRSITPVEWEAKYNQELRFVARPGRTALLVADEAVLSGRRQIARPNTARRKAAGRGNASVPIFVLLPLVKFRNAFAVEPMIQRAERRLLETFVAETARAGAP